MTMKALATPFALMLAALAYFVPIVAGGAPVAYAACTTIAILAVMSYGADLILSYLGEVEPRPHHLLGGRRLCRVDAGGQCRLERLGNGWRGHRRVDRAGRRARPCDAAHRATLCFRW